MALATSRSFVIFLQTSFYLGSDRSRKVSKAAHARLALYCLSFRSVLRTVVMSQSRFVAVFILGACILIPLPGTTIGQKPDPKNNQVNKGGPTPKKDIAKAPKRDIKPR